MKKKWAVTLVLGILVLGGGGYWAYQYFQAKPQTTSLITSTVKKGDVKQQITATGIVKYPEEVPLAFEQAGTVKEIYVQAGDVVKAGQVLAQKDTDTLQQELSESIASLKEAELNWQQQIVEAEGALVKAKQSLKTAQQNADSAYLANQLHIAEQNVAIASNNLAKAQQGGDESSIQQAKSSLAQAQNNLMSVQNTYDGGAAQAVETSKADLKTKESNLSRLGEKTSLSKAQTAVVKAQENLAKATLIAPADGVIIDVPVKKGQNVNNNSTTVMTLATGGNLLIVDSTVSQAEVSQIKAGQKVSVTLDSAPNDSMSATVKKVALKATTTQNVTTFMVTMQMDQASGLLRAGMNVNVGIIVAEAKNVLTIPSQALRTQGNQKGVLVVQNSGTTNSSATESSSSSQGKANRQSQEGTTSDSSNVSSSQNTTQQPGGNKTQNSSAGSNRTSQAGNQGTTTETNTRFVPVEVGLDDGANVEIKSGLFEGQVIVTGTRSTSTTTNTNSRQGGTSIPGIGGGSIPGVRIRN
jgi:HlyD family secretion protein